MKKKKYGEETVVIRVPKSRKLDVLNLLKNFEVLDSSMDSTPPVDHLRNAYLKGFNDCFERWELYNLSLPLILTGNKASLPLLNDLYQRNIPESAFLSALQEYIGVLSSASAGKKYPALAMAQNYMNESLDKARETLEQSLEQSLSNLPDLIGQGDSIH